MCLVGAGDAGSPHAWLFSSVTPLLWGPSWVSGASWPTRGKRQVFLFSTSSNQYPRKSCFIGLEVVGLFQIIWTKWVKGATPGCNLKGVLMLGGKKSPPQSLQGSFSSLRPRDSLTSKKMLRSVIPGRPSQPRRRAGCGEGVEGWTSGVEDAIPRAGWH